MLSEPDAPDRRRILSAGGDRVLGPGGDKDEFQESADMHSERQEAKVHPEGNALDAISNVDSF